MPKKKTKKKKKKKKRQPRVVQDEEAPKSIYGIFAGQQKRQTMKHFFIAGTEGRRSEYAKKGDPEEVGTP